MTCERVKPTVLYFIVLGHLLSIHTEVWFGLVYYGLLWFGLVWLGWVGLGWVGLGWVGLGWVYFSLF